VFQVLLLLAEVIAWYLHITINCSHNSIY